MGPGPLQHREPHTVPLPLLPLPLLLICLLLHSSGVNPAKIRVVPEAIDTDLWDPARYSPVNLTRLGLVQATGPPAGPNASLPAASMLQGKAPANGQKPYGEGWKLSI
jgi:hypothetical protein